MVGLDKSKIRLHRTSSSRKARRKNEFDGNWADFKRHSLQDETKKKDKKFKWSKNSVKRWVQLHLTRIVTVSIAAAFALWYLWYTASLFENSTRFSHLTNVERELSLPTDVAFRYSFFKKIVLAERYLDGLRLVTQDQKQQAERLSPIASSFHRYSLSPEVILAGVFHGLKNVKNWTGWPRTNCKVVSPAGSESSGSTSFTAHRPSNHSGNGQNYKDDNFFTLSCSGLSDPLHFYLAAARTLECVIMVLIFFMGLAFGNSIFGGIFAVAIFVFLHPQRSNYEWLFPVQEKIGWILVVIQIYTVFRSVFCKVHPPWTAVVKIGLSTAALILGWNTDAQWFLASQLIIMTVLHICGGFSRYVASLVILGQLTGWQYASLVSLDPAFHHWSFFMYTLSACLVTVIVIEPLVDWILGKKRDKWKFLRGSILLITFQTILISVRCDLGQTFTFLEDSRFPLTIGDSYEGTKPWTLVYQELKDPSKFIPEPNELQNSRLLQGNPSEDMNIANKFVYSAKINTDNNNKGRLQDSTHTKEARHCSVHDDEKATYSDVLSLQMTEFLRSCFLSQAKSSSVKFLSKYFFLIFATLYTITVAVLLPLCSSSSEKGSWETINEKELWEFGDANGIRNSWNPLNSSFLLFGESDEDEQPCSCSEDDEDKLQHLFNTPNRTDSNEAKWRYLHRNRQMMKSEINLWLWESYLSYHIAQTAFFGIFCLWLDKRWEIFFVPHVCLLLSLLCDSGRVRKLLKTSPFSYAYQIHWAVVFAIVGILVASARLRSNAMYQKARGRFEIGNARVGGLMEAVKWIRENTELSAGFAGADNLMVALDLSAQRLSVNHHLTVHSWANKNTRKRGDKEQRLQDKLQKEEMSELLRTNSRQAPLPIRTRATRNELHEKDSEDEVLSEEEVDDDEREEQEELGSKKGKSTWNLRGLDAKLATGDCGAAGHSNKETSDQSDEKTMAAVTMTSLLTGQELQALAKVYSVFSRNKSVLDFHSGLVSLNVTYFILSQQMCPESTSIHSTTSGPSSVLNTISHTLVSSSGSNSRAGNNLVGRSGTVLPPSKLDSAQIFFQPEEEEQEMERRNFSISGIWQWHWNWQESVESHESQLSSFQFPKRCDFARFWDDVEKTQQPTTESTKIDSGDPYAKGQPTRGDSKFRFQSGASYYRTGFNKRGRDSKDEDVNTKKKIENTPTYDSSSEDTLCHRLLHERNVLPFRRVFQNAFFTILAV